MKIESTDKKKVFTLDGHILNAVRVAYYGPHSNSVTHITKYGWELQYKGVALLGRKVANTSYGFHPEFVSLKELVADIDWHNDDSKYGGNRHMGSIIRQIEKAK